MATIEVERFRALQNLPGGQRHGNDNISKTFHFDDFAATTRFVDRVALAAAAAGRQPAIDIRSDRVTVAFAPGDGHTLTLEDVAAARRIQRSSATTATQSAGSPGAPRTSGRHPPAPGGSGRTVGPNRKPRGPAADPAASWPSQPSAILAGPG